MTVNYADWGSGNDTTGNGSAGNPYKTIDKASTGLSGGDEVRCAKTTDPSTLSGTLTWTDNSPTVSTSVSLVGTVAAGDIIGKPTAALDSADETWWVVSSVAAGAITLTSNFYGTSEAIANCKHVPTSSMFNTGTGTGGIGTNAYSALVAPIGIGVSGYIAGGGGAGSFAGVSALGGSGGGGNGGNNAAVGSNGVANTGGGGGGGGAAAGTGYSGGNGGSGFIIVRYAK